MRLRSPKCSLALSLLCLFWFTAKLFPQIAGDNVNMVSGTKWPGGDPFLQRQNEPSLAVSTRNPLHLLAGANDYRSVDLETAESLPDDLDAGDAWLGMFKSFDGGRSWQSTLLPGYPRDNSAAGVTSPLHGYTTASDPTVRAGTNGMFYYSGIAFNRGSNLGEVFVARFSDFNNKENGDATQFQDAIRYVGATRIESGTAGQFLDKPWIATDIPRGGGTCHIQAQQADGSFVTQSFPAGNVYIVYSVFLGHGNNQHSKIVFRRSTDCGATWGPPVNVAESYALSQGATIAVDPQTGAVYVAWRTFSSRNQPDQIVVARSLDFGSSFTQGVPVVTLPAYNATNPAAPSFFDQNTTGTSFRTNAFPSIAVDDSGSVGAPGRLYVAWSQRGIGASGDARIVLSTSMDGVSWSAPTPVDNQPVVDDAGNSFDRGHQIMPELTFVGGKLMATYYDLRLDHTVGMFAPNKPLFVANNKGEFYQEYRDPIGELVSDPSRVFTSFIDDAGLTQRRHTLEVMVAQSDGGPVPAFTTAKASQYEIGIRGDASGDDEQLQELQVNPPNLPLFAQGSEPFIGDYIDIVGQMFVSINGRWVFNNRASGGSPANSAVHYAVWTSDQDVRAPQDGNWKHYTPVGFGSGRQSTYDPTQTIPDCVPGQEGMRNQNIYSSQITQGLLLSSPQNTKPLSTSFQRGFVVLVQNYTGMKKSFRLTISAPAGVFASFQQILPNPTPPIAFPSALNSVDVTVASHSGAARTVFAMLENGGAGLTPAITINAYEIDGPGASGPRANGLSSFVVLNADGSAPPLISADNATGAASAEIYDASVSDPNVTNPNAPNPNAPSLNVTNPNVTNPNVTNPNVTNPNVTNPDLANPNVTNPNVTNSNIVDPNVTNPDVSNPNVTNANLSDSPTADATYQITNKGNTTASYRVRLAGNTSTSLQMLLTKTYTTPVGVNCQLMEESQQTVQTNVGTAAFDDFQTLSDPNVTNPNVTNATIALAPGETALVTLRGQNVCGDAKCATQHPELAKMTDIVQHEVAPVVVPQAVNTTDTTATAPAVTSPPIPLIATSSLPNAAGGNPYSTTLQAVGGTPPYSWGVSLGSLPPGFSLDSASGTVSNVAPGSNAPGAYSFTAQVTDSAGKFATRDFGIAVINPVNVQIFPAFGFFPFFVGSYDTGSSISFGGGVICSFSAFSASFGSSQGNFNWHPCGAGAFGARITGSIVVPADGNYTFTITSDDGSYLFIDGALMVNNGGGSSGHAEQAASSSVYLNAGIHAFELQFFENGAGQSGVDLSLPVGVSYAP